MTFALRTKPAIGAIVMLALGFAVLLAAGPGTPNAAAGHNCPNASSEPNEATTGEFREAISCLINKRRTSRGIDAVDVAPKLRKVAGDHVDVMLAQDCFKHTCSGEDGLTRRLKDIGYLQGSEWAYAEIMGYERTPRKMIDAWMDSSYHRNNILKAEFVDFGVGVGKGTPDPDKPDSAFVTYDVIFGDGG